MLEIKLTNINYRIGEDGNTSEIGTSFSGYQGNESVNANMPLVAADLKEGTTLDDLSRKQIEAAGRKKLADAVAIKSDTSEDEAAGTDNVEVSAK